MPQNSQDRVKQIAANRSKARAKGAALTTDPVTFQDWLFYGTEPNIFVNVGIVPSSSSITIEYAVVVLQTPSEFVLCDAAINVSNPASITFNMSTDSGTFSISEFGDQVQAWAYVITNAGDQYSDTQSYTVSS